MNNRVTFYHLKIFTTHTLLLFKYFHFLLYEALPNYELGGREAKPLNRKLNPSLTS